MKRHPGMAANICPGNQGESPDNLATQIAAHPPPETTQHLELTAGLPRLGPPVRGRAPAKRWRAAHTLLLSGRLDRSSTHMLEAEIERLCESGVRQITLDVTHLTGIDFTGVAVIAFRRKWCRRRGCALFIVRAMSDVRLAFEAAGAGGLLDSERADSTTDAPDATITARRVKHADASGRGRVVARDADADLSAAAPVPAATATPVEEADRATV
jgi:anti-anti-sigma factor